MEASFGLRWQSVLLTVFVLGVGLFSTGCQSVEFYEKEALANPLMLAEPDRGEAHFRQKVHSSREASIGGMGESAGGGCGCY